MFILPCHGSCKLENLLHIPQVNNIHTVSSPSFVGLHHNVCQKNGRREEKGKPVSDVEGGGRGRRAINAPKKYGQEGSEKKKPKLSVDSRGLEEVTCDDPQLARDSDYGEESSEEDHHDAETTLRLSELYS